MRTSRRSSRVTRRCLPAKVASLALVLTSCTAAPPQSASIEVNPRIALVSHPVQIRVTGLAAQEQVTLQAGTTDGEGKHFFSRATFFADENGAVDLASAAPTSGTYSDAAAMGLIWSLQPRDSDATSEYAESFVGTQTISLRVTSGDHTLATTTIQRRARGPGVTTKKFTVARDGFRGEMFMPANVDRAGSALMYLGGSEGRYHIFEPEVLASEGIPTISVAYFNDPGLPKQLHDIPLEYFVRPLRYLAQRPGVDPGRVFVEGFSRGTEAAMLLGIDFPQLVHGVVAIAPSDVVGCAFPGQGSAWTLNGHALPCSLRPFAGVPAPPHTLLHVEDIRGPVLLECGGFDKLWNACHMGRSLMARLTRHGTPYRHVLLSYPDAGHGIGLVPYVPQQNFSLAGKTREANPLAWEDAWPRLLQFLRAG
jgi:dienelactone hydrolase